MMSKKRFRRILIFVGIGLFICLGIAGWMLYEGISYDDRYLRQLALVARDMTEEQKEMFIRDADSVLIWLKETIDSEKTDPETRFEATISYRLVSEEREIILKSLKKSGNKNRKFFYDTKEIIEDPSEEKRSIENRNDWSYWSDAPEYLRKRSEKEWEDFEKEVGRITTEERQLRLQKTERALVMAELIMGSIDVPWDVHYNARISHGERLRERRILIHTLKQNHALSDKGRK